MMKGGLDLFGCGSSRSGEVWCAPLLVLVDFGLVFVMVWSDWIEYMYIMCPQEYFHLL